MIHHTYYRNIVPPHPAQVDSKYPEKREEIT
jgi:hypothetical protein